LQELEQWEMEKRGFEIVLDVCEAFNRAWGYKLDQDEIESKAMDWLARRQSYLMNSRSASAFTALAYKSLFRKLSTLGQDMLLERSMIRSYGGYEVEEAHELESGTIWHAYTTEEVLIGLECGREEFFEMSKEFCTSLQSKAILKRYQDKKDIKVIGEEDGRSPSAVHDLIKAGIKNIASKSIKA
jgi:hypothetical protein